MEQLAVINFGVTSAGSLVDSFKSSLCILTFDIIFVGSPAALIPLWLTLCETKSIFKMGQVAVAVAEKEKEMDLRDDFFSVLVSVFVCACVIYVSVYIGTYIYSGLNTEHH